MDETPIFLYDLTRKISKKGGKSIKIRAQNQEKWRVFALLKITEDGNKLLRLLYLKKRLTEK